MSLDSDAARAWFHPRSILVTGASRDRVTLANLFLRRQREFGYSGPIHVLHPAAAEIEGFPCVPSFDALPEPVDFAYVAIPAPRVPAFLSRAAGRLRVAQIVTAGFRESGDDGRRLEEEMVDAARGSGIRLVGPNCMGSYSPGGRLTMVDGAPLEPGDIGVASQSGVAAADVIKMGRFGGGRFTQVVSLGNCADIDVVDLFEHFAADPATGVIGLYLEGLERGRAFVDVARRVEGAKPTVVLKGGMTDQGQRSVASHTGALASDHRIWHGLAAQLGFVLKDSLDGFVSSLVCFSHWRRSPASVGRRCCIVGPGGVLSVLGTDLLRRSGFDVPRLGAATLARLEEFRLPPGSSLLNPIDTPVGVMQAQGGHAFGRILDIVAAAGEADWFVIHLSLQNLYSYLGDPDTALENGVSGLLDVAMRFNASARWAVVLRTNDDPVLDELRARYRERMIDQGMPVFRSLESAADAMRDFVRWHEHGAGIRNRGSSERTLQ